MRLGCRLLETLQGLGLLLLLIYVFVAIDLGLGRVNLVVRLVVLARVYQHLLLLLLLMFKKM